MALAQNSVKRAVDASGNDLRTFTDGAIEVQGAVIVGDAGEHVGIDAAPLISAERAASFFASGGAAVDQAVVKNLAGTLFEFHVIVLSSVVTPRWIHVHDAGAAVSTGAVPVERIVIDSAGQGRHRYRTSGRAFVNGIVIAISSTEASTTLPGGGGDALFHAEFR